MYTGKLRENKLRQLESAISKQEKFIFQYKKENEDAVLASYMLSEMISKSSRPFTEGGFIEDCMLKEADILCPEKKFFEGIISLAANTVFSPVDEFAANT